MFVDPFTFLFSVVGVYLLRSLPKTLPDFDFDSEFLSNLQRSLTSRMSERIASLIGNVRQFPFSLRPNKSLGG